MQLPRHLLHTVKRGLPKLLVDQQHEVEVHRGLALRHCIPTGRLGWFFTIIPFGIGLEPVAARSLITCRSGV
jgi:hypothetical protein